MGDTSLAGADARAADSSRPLRHHHHYLAALPKLVVFDGSFETSPTDTFQSGTATQATVLDWIADLTDVRGAAAVWNCGHVELSTPRGVPWSEFPLIRERSPKPGPAYAKRMFVFSPGSAKSVYNIDCEAVLGGAECFVFILVGHGGAVLDIEEARRTLDRQLLLIEGARGGRDARAFVITPLHDPRETALSTLRTEVAPYGVVPKFLMNYADNATAILGRALRNAWDADAGWASKWYRDAAVIADGGLGGGDFSSSALREKISATFIDSLKAPLGLQALYRVARTECRCELNRETQTPWMIKDWLRRTATGVAGAPSDDGKEVAWIGTGAYEPVIVRRERLGEALWDSIIFGLVDIDKSTGTETGRLALSARGRKFLELVHPDMEDADILARWGLMENRPATAKEAEAMDSWLLRNFRKTKNRLAKTA